jgi:SAM-dependent methyltransferase
MTNKTFKDDLIEAYNKHAQEREGNTLEDWKIENRAEFLSFLQKENRHSFLELGSGTGKDSLFFNENGLNVTCVDLSPQMVKFCQQKGLSAQVMDMADLQFSADSFDVVYSFNSLLHIPKNELSIVLENIKRVLKPNGVFHLGIYGSDQESEGIWEEDFYVPKRFFSFYSDEHLQEITSQYFDLISFKRLTVDNSKTHFQRLILRKL